MPGSPISSIISLVLVSAAMSGCGGGEDADQTGKTAALPEQSNAMQPRSFAINPLPTDAIFAPTSFWYQTIPANTPLHPNNAAFVAEFARLKTTFYNTVSISMESWSSPVYAVPSNLPTQRVDQAKCFAGSVPNSGLARQWAEVPIPAYAQPASGSDAEMTIYQASSDTLWEFWKAKNADGVWTGCWGGKMENVSQSDGIWRDRYGTTATGLPFLGGQITAEELARGEIRHAIGIALPEVESANIFSWPAQRSDGANPLGKPNRIPQGTRFRLDPSIDVDALNIRPAAKVVAKAAQKYGFVVWDKAGSISIRSQNPKTYTAAGQPNPYPALFFNAPSYAVLSGIPWDRLQFMPQDYGRP